MVPPSPATELYPWQWSGPGLALARTTRAPEKASPDWERGVNRHEYELDCLMRYIVSFRRDHAERWFLRGEHVHLWKAYPRWRAGGGFGNGSLICLNGMCETREYPSREAARNFVPG